MESFDGLKRKPAAGAVLALLACFGLMVGCTADRPLGLSDTTDGTPVLKAAGARATIKATGTVEIEWPGGRGRDVAPGEEKLAFADFDAFPSTARKAVRGSFTYRVLNADLTPHREIVAVVSAAMVDGDNSRAWFIGEVVSDIKICAGEACDGHDGGGGSDGGTHDDGGCSGGGTDGGGTHDDGGCSGGGSDGGTHDDSGCSGGGTDGGGTHDDGGCSDGGTNGGCTDGSSHDDDGGCSGGGGGHAGGGSVPGNVPRVGQFVVVKLHDLGTPGVAGDRISWKWFAPEDTDVLPPTDVIWPQGFHLCPKTIIGGNLKVHSKM